MSEDDIDRLVAERSLVRQPFDDRQVMGFWAKAVASYRDAQVSEISTDGRLQLAYTAGLQATFAVLAAVGLRVKSTSSHYKAFYAMQKLDDPVLQALAVRFDELRATRHESIYEPGEDETAVAERLGEAVDALALALPAMRGWLVAHRSNLDRMLVEVRDDD